jgi:protein-S-isoprenylcysteine O-methyltransferase Ste14
METLKSIVFLADTLISLLLVGGAVWSVAVPDRRLWPPPGRKSWQFRLVWACFLAVFLMNAFLLITDWNSWDFPGQLRFLIGIPLALIGGGLAVWGIASLGPVNTSGIPEGFINKGPYRFTRNPQYLGDNLLFLGLSITANSDLLWISQILLIIVFLITPLAEEVWLERQYGEPYMEYKNTTARFL